MEMNAYGTFNVDLSDGGGDGRERDRTRTAERGVVVNTASIAGIEGQAGQVAYGAAKAGASSA